MYLWSSMTILFHNNVAASILPLHNQMIENFVANNKKEAGVWNKPFEMIFIGVKTLCEVLCKYCVRHTSLCASLFMTLFTSLFMSLCSSGILQRHCAHHCVHQESCGYIVHITVRVRNPVDTLFMLLYASGILQRHWSPHCARQESYRDIVHITMCITVLAKNPAIHVTVNTILTAKIVDVMMTVGSICNKFSYHDTINLSPNIFFYTHKTIPWWWRYWWHAWYLWPTSSA